MYKLTIRSITKILAYQIFANKCTNLSNVCDSVKERVKLILVEIQTDTPIRSSVICTWEAPTCVQSKQSPPARSISHHHIC